MPFKRLLFFIFYFIIIKLSGEICRSGGMADAMDSKSIGSNTVWVQVPPSAPNKKNTL